MVNKQKHHIVTEFNQNIDALKGFALIVNTHDWQKVNEINDVVNRHNKLHCIVLHFDGKLSSVPLQDSWKNIPIHLFVNDMGAFKDFVPKLRLLRALNIRVFLSSDIKENFTNLQILSSLGVDCGIYFGKKPIEWELLNDLMHYAIYGKVPRGTIEPFHYIVTHYHPQEYLNFETVYFNNPLRYLHLDEKGRIALTAENKNNNIFISENLQDIFRVNELDVYLEKTTYIKDDFLNFDGCASCSAWRICLGGFKNKTDKGLQCQEFMNDMLEACEYYASKNNVRKVKELCQL